MSANLLTPKALALATLLLTAARANPGELYLCFSDAELAHDLDLEADSVYRALIELRLAEALDFTRPFRSTGSSVRFITLDTACWVWSAVAAALRPRVRGARSKKNLVPGETIYIELKKRQS